MMEGVVPEEDGDDEDDAMVLRVGQLEAQGAPSKEGEMIKEIDVIPKYVYKAREDIPLRWCGGAPDHILPW